MIGPTGVGIIECDTIAQCGDRRNCNHHQSGLDHQETLGDNQVAIAEQKAGIFKPGKSACDCKLLETRLSKDSY